MAIPTIFDLCIPRDDVVKGTIADSDYAANLANVLTGRASRDYTDAPTFFTNTYPTEGLKELLINVCGRLSGRGESVSAVFRLAPGRKSSPIFAVSRPIPPPPA